MIIKSIHVDGFGQLENETYQLDHKFHLIFGPNEAGKTTIMSFVEQILFGFKTKQSSERRYEPKHNGKYGGRIQVIDSDGQPVVIERVKGKAAGDVTITFANGHIGGEAELQAWLKGLGRATAHNIYHFNVFGLQAIHQITQEELSRYLFSSSLVGTDDIRRLEKQLDKEAEELFKPNGRKPLLNEWLKQLTEDEIKLKEVEKKNESYSKRRQELMDCLSKEDELRKQHDSQQEELLVLHQLSEKWSVYESIQQLEYYLAAQQEVAFPDEASRKMDIITESELKLERSIQTATAQWKRKQREAEQYQKNLIEEPILEELQRFIDQKTLYEQWQEEYKEWENEVTYLDNELMKLQRDLQVQSNQIPNQLGMEMQANIEETLRLEERLLIKKETLDSEQTNIAMAIATLEETINKIEYQMQHKKSGKQKKGKQKISFYILNGMFLLLLFICLTTNEWLLFTAIFVLMIITNVLLTQTAKREVQDHSITEQRKAYLYDLDKKKEQEQLLKDKIIQWEREHHKLIKNLLLIKEELLLLPSFPSAQLLNAVWLWRDMEKKMNERNYIERKKNEKQIKMNNWQEKFQSYCELFHFAAERRTISLLESQFILERQKRVQYNELLGEIKPLAEHVILLEEEQQSIVKQKQELLRSAKVQTIEEFRERATNYQDVKTKRKQLEQLYVQIPAALLSEFHHFSSKGECERRIDQINEELAERKVQIQSIQHLAAEIKIQLQQLESGGLYADLIQEFYMKQAVFQEQAENYLVKRTAWQILSQTIERYQRDRLPAVIQQAKEYFSYLTFGRYENIWFNETDGLIIGRKDGLHLQPYELSQATKEQLYVALRLALAMHMNKHHAFPIIIDDAFVHFDQNRLKRMLHLLIQISKKQQVLLFTCHEFVKDLMLNHSTTILEDKTAVGEINV